MKTITLLMFSLFLGNCNGQKNNIKKDNLIQNDTVMKSFDIQEYKERQKNSTTTYTLNNRTTIELLHSGNEKDGTIIYVKNEIPPYPELFYIYKEFYSNGSIKEYGQRYKNGYFQKGNWKYFTKDGGLKESVNYDVPFEYKWEDIELYCKKEKINLELNTTQITRFSEELEKPIWEISYLLKGQNKELIIDGKTGKLIEENLFPISK